MPGSSASARSSSVVPLRPRPARKTTRVIGCAAYSRPLEANPSFEGSRGTALKTSYWPRA